MGFSDKQRALRDSEVIISLVAQARMIQVDRANTHAKLDAASIERVREARDLLSQVLEDERTRDKLKR